MNPQPCAEMRLLLQADHDGELPPADAARVAAHLATCRDCAAAQRSIAALSQRIRTELPRHTAPAHLRASLRTAMPRRRAWRPFAAGLAVAAALALVIVIPNGSDLTDSVVASHIRALQPGHLTDVASTDQHTVKPWFDGRLDFAPPVKDLASRGFPLIGGRLDYLAGRPVAAMAYHRAQHVIDLYAWPTTGPSRQSAAERNGYNTIRWTRNAMTFWAVSDLNPAELAEFVALWQTMD
jgi:anti-sigma factor RsiW